MTTEEDNSVIVVDGKVLVNTEYVAMLISENTKADLYRIEPKPPYTNNHTDLVNQSKEAQNVRPEIKTKISNFDDYDIIYVGYPIWNREDKLSLRDGSMIIIIFLMLKDCFLN